MKRVLLLMALGACSVAQAQYYAGEDRILSALQKLRNEQQLYLHIEGSETVNGVTTIHKTHLFWQYDTSGSRPALRVNILNLENDVLVHRIVGNGETIWNYDVRNRQYQAVNYGGFGSGRLSSYQRDLIGHINRFAKGHAVYGTRLLREIYGDETANYRSWMPGIQPQELPDAPPTQDPIFPDRTYSGSATVDYLMYNGAPRRAILFELEDDPPSDIYRLSAIIFSERVQLGTRTRETYWHLRPYKGIAFDPAEFIPFSYDQTRGWKPLVGTKAYKG